MLVIKRCFLFGLLAALVLPFPTEGRALQGNSSNAVFVPGLFDTINFPWGEEIFQFTVSLINDHSDGWFDDVLNDGTIVDWSIANSTCDATLAARAYWDLRTENGGKPHGIVGCRCSSASIAVARIAGLEEVPQNSPSSTSARLSDKDKFPFVSRVISTEETSAIVSVLRSFDWNRLTILTTDTQYGKDQATEMVAKWTGKHEDASGTWEGEIAYSHTITLNSDGSVNEDSVRQALNGVPTDDPSTNSRIILLIAHDQHAYPILRIAAETNFQPDTIWVGTQSWTNRAPPDGDMSWFPQVPGYIGLTPYRNRDDVYVDYLTRLQAAQVAEGREPWQEMPDYAAENLVDSILSIIMALSSAPREKRLDGSLVASALLNLTFNGISGPVSFTEKGDRRDPKFTIFNLQPSSAGVSWVDVGVAETAVGDTILHDGVEAMCFADVGCGLSTAPSDSYPVPSTTPVVLFIVIPVFMVLLLCVTVLYCRSNRKKKALKDIIEATKKIDGELLDIDQQVGDAKRRRDSLILKRAQLQGMPDTWSDTVDTKVEVSPEDEQYWTVLNRMRETMDDVHISKLWRIQNTSLYSYYSFHKARLISNNIDHGERGVWHGTSSLDPSVIYDDKMDGFMMQFAAEGFWGRGLYFADKAVYSTHYAFKPHQASLVSSFTSAPNGRPQGKDDEREMFYAKLLVGNEIFLDRDASSTKAREYRKLSVPPEHPSRRGERYNTVTGNTGGSQVWVVYENGRAYPDYLVRYYRGDRDPKRSPFASKGEAMKKKNFASTSSTSSSSSCPSSYKWEFLDNSGWQPYSAIHQAILERHFQDVARKTTKISTVTIQSDEWKYEVDVSKMTQTNTQHSGRRQRDVRRAVVT